MVPPAPSVLWLWAWDPAWPRGGAAPKGAPFHHSWLSPLGLLWGFKACQVSPLFSRVTHKHQQMSNLGIPAHPHEQHAHRRYATNFN